LEAVRRRSQRDGAAASAQVIPRAAARDAGDIGALATGRPLDPPQSMPDTLLAWCDGAAPGHDVRRELAVAVARSLSPDA
jgi:hypothetical protein